MSQKSLQIGNINYKFIKLIGKGSYGSVYLAESQRSKKYYIIKEAKKIEEAKVERAILFRIKPECSKYLVCIHDFLFTANPKKIFPRYYIVLDFIPNTIDLSKLNSKISLWTEFNIALNLCKGLAVLHKYIVHRDIKPENIIIDQNMNIHYIDYGLSCGVNESKEDSKEIGRECLMNIVGTPEFTAPELHEYENIDKFSQKELIQIWKRADIFSLGCVLFDLFFKQNFSEYCSKFRFNIDLYIVKGLTKLKKETENDPIRYFLYNLVIKLLDPEPKNRATSVELITFLEDNAERFKEMIPASERKTTVVVEKFGMANAVYKSANSPKYSFNRRIKRSF